MRAKDLSAELDRLDPDTPVVVRWDPRPDSVTLAREECRAALQPLRVAPRASDPPDAAGAGRAGRRATVGTVAV